MILGLQYKLRSSTLRSFLQPPVRCCLLGRTRGVLSRLVAGFSPRDPGSVPGQWRTEWHCGRFSGADTAGRTERAQVPVTSERARFRFPPGHPLFMVSLSPFRHIPRLCRDRFVPNPFQFIIHNRGHAVAQVVEALRYKPEGRRFEPR
jgi:hypothetical protein